MSSCTREGIWELDLVTNVAYYNNGMQDLFGYAFDEMKNNEKWWIANVHPQDKKRVAGSMGELLLSSENVWWGRYKFRCKDGTYKPVLDRLFVVRDKHQKALRLIGTMQDLTEVNTLQDELEDFRTAHKRNMFLAMFNASEKEKKGISDELNENINQVLAGISMYITEAKSHADAEGAEKLNEAKVLLLESISGIRLLADRLSPPMLQLLGLKDALRDLIASTLEAKNIKCYFEFDELNLPPKPKYKVILFYRIIQQQISNIINHSNADAVSISISKNGKKAVITIRDNGDGVDAANLTYGEGFSNFQQFTEPFDGSFMVQSTVGEKGFTVELML